MGGTLRTSNRELLMRNKSYLETKQEQYPYRYTTKNGIIKIGQVEGLGLDFIRVPLPGKNQVVWGFENYESLAVFKGLLLSA
jgi:hypothetical protein